MSHVVVSQAHDLAELRPAYWTAAGKQLRQSSLGQTAWGTAPVVRPQFVLEMFSGPMVLRYISGSQVTMSYLRKLVPQVIAALAAGVISLK